MFKKIRNMLPVWFILVEVVLRIVFSCNFVNFPKPWNKNPQLNSNVKPEEWSEKEYASITIFYQTYLVIKLNNTYKNKK